MLDIDNAEAQAHSARTAAFHRWQDTRTVADTLGRLIAESQIALLESNGVPVDSTMRRYVEARVVELDAWCAWIDMTKGAPR